MPTDPQAQEQGESGWVEVVLDDGDPIPRGGELTPEAYAEAVAEQRALKAYMERELEARKRWAKLPSAEQRNEAARRFKAQEERDWRLACARGQAFDRLPLARPQVRTRDMHLPRGPRRGDRRLGGGRPRAAARSSSRGGDSGDSDGESEPASRRLHSDNLAPSHRCSPKKGGRR
jgi:hypothetical protein